MRKEFSFFLFSTDPEMIRPAIDSGVAGIMLDWENVGKENRQNGADTQINYNTPEDLIKVRACTPARIIVRVNALQHGALEEADLAIELGADEIMLPMVRSVDEVQTVLAHVKGRIQVGMLVETVAATQIIDGLARLPLSRVYVGLNDLGIERRTSNIFTAVADGLVERVRLGLSGIPFGFAGLTLPELGSPIPCRLLIGEMARLDCDFTFLRRSFHRDIAGREMKTEVPRMLAAIETARHRSADQIDNDHQDLVREINSWHKYDGKVIPAIDDRP